MKLSKEDFLKTFDAPMIEVQLNILHLDHILSYAQIIHNDDFECFENLNTIAYTYWNKAKGFWHFLVRTDNPDVFMVVLTTSENNIHGHYLLNLPEEFGIT